jgi:hypothetical protein
VHQHQLSPGLPGGYSWLPENLIRFCWVIVIKKPENGGNYSGNLWNIGGCKHLCPPHLKFCRGPSPSVPPKSQPMVVDCTRFQHCQLKLSSLECRHRAYQTRVVSLDDHWQVLFSVVCWKVPTFASVLSKFWSLHPLLCWIGCWECKNCNSYCLLSCLSLIIISLVTALKRF